MKDEGKRSEPSLFAPKDAVKARARGGGKNDEAARRRAREAAALRANLLRRKAQARARAAAEGRPEED